MRVNKVNELTIILIVQSSLSFVSSDLVSMYVRLEAASSLNYIYMNFYDDMFQRMYNCMTDACTRQCNAKGMLQNSGASHPGLNLIVTDVTSTTRTTCVPVGSFTCQFDQAMFELKCTRNSTGQCGANTCTSFRLSNSSMCECVSLMWKYTDEELVYDSKTNIGDCKQDCTSTTTATTNPSNATKIANSDSDNPSSNSVSIILGVVCAVLFIVIVLLVGIIYRQKKQMKRLANNTDVRTVTDHNKIPAKPTLTRLSNSSNVPVVWTLPYSGHERGTNGESEDGYYSIDRNSELKYENDMNMGFHKTAHSEDQRALNSHEIIVYQNEI